MSHYDKSYVTKIIYERAAARRERARLRSNVDALQVYVPFQEYLKYAYGIEDWRTVRRYKLWEYYNDYQCICAGLKLDWESPTVYGLYNTLL